MGKQHVRENGNIVVEYDHSKIIKECTLECFYDKEIDACGSCLRSLQEIAEAGRERKQQEDDWNGF